MRYIVSTLLLLLATVLFGSARTATLHAQDKDEEQQLALNQFTRQTNSSIIEYVVSLQEKRIVDIAEEMPADKYNFMPKHGEFKGVRTFAEQLVHIASDNYVLGAGILQEKPPAEVGDGESGDRSL